MCNNQNSISIKNIIDQGNRRTYEAYQHIINEVKIPSLYVHANYANKKISISQMLMKTYQTTWHHTKYVPFKFKNTEIKFY